MSSIFGIFYKTGMKVDSKEIDQLNHELAYWEPDKTSLIIHNDIALGHHMLFTTSISKNEILPYFDDDSGYLITADARIDYREELLNELGKPKSLIKTISDSKLILLAYRKWGSDCTKHLFGDFAFVIANTKRKELFCSRDHFGCRPFYYYNDDEVFIFSSEIKAILSTSRIRFQISESYIVDSIASLPIENQKTAFEPICRLKPANNLLVRTDSLRMDTFWNLQSTKLYQSCPEEEAKREFLKRLKRSVKERCRTDFPIGVELSGGLDSSGVATIAKELLKESDIGFSAFTQVLDRDLKGCIFPFVDESNFSELIARELKIKNHYLIAGSNGLNCCKLVEEFVMQNQRPVWLLYALMSDQLFKKANENNIRIMLSGFGGDQGVTLSSGGYFEEVMHYTDKKTLKELIERRTSRVGGNTNRTLLRLYINKLAPLVMDLWQYYSLKRRYKHIFNRRKLIRSELSIRYRLKQRIRDNTWLPSGYDMKQRQAKKMTQNSISERLENTWLLGHKYRIEYRYSLLDVKLVELFYSLPANLKFKDGYGRYLFRATLNDILPLGIWWRQEKSGTPIPSVYSRILKDEKEILKLIDDAERNNTFHYINYDVLRSTFSKFKDKSTRPRNGVTNRDIINPLSVLILQKWQREGTIDLGIKC